jgi:hypothetical protein
VVDAASPTASQSAQVTITGAYFPPCCTYLLHLRAWKRTTSGCTDQPERVVRGLHPEPVIRRS